MFSLFSAYFLTFFAYPVLSSIRFCILFFRFVSFNPFPLFFLCLSFFPVLFFVLLLHSLYLVLCFVVNIFFYLFSYSQFSTVPGVQLTHGSDTQARTNGNHLCGIKAGRPASLHLGSGPCSAHIGKNLSK